MDCVVPTQAASTKLLLHHRNLRCCLGLHRQRSLVRCRDQIRSHCTVRNLKPRNPTNLDRILPDALPLHDAHDAHIHRQSRDRPILPRRQLQPEKETVGSVKRLDTLQSV
jgi:hypothetical protein